MVTRENILYIYNNFQFRSLVPNKQVSLTIDKPLTLLYHLPVISVEYPCVFTDKHMSGPIARFLQMWGWWWCRPAWWRETLPTAVTSTVRVFVPSLPSSSSQCTSFIDLYLRICQNNLKGNSLRYAIHSRTSGRVGNIRVESYEISILLEISCLTLARQSDVIG